MSDVARRWLSERLSRFPDRVAVAAAKRCVSYRRLGEELAQWRRVLRENDIAPGAVVGIQGDYSPATVALFLALVAEGHIVVPIAATSRDPQCALDLAHARWLFAVDDDESWTLTRRASAPAPALLAGLCARGAPGLIVLSSGTTGESKAALYDFAVLLRRYRQPRRARRTLVFLYLDHLGGVHTLLHTLACGGTVVVGGERHPQRVCAAIERHRVQVLPTTPTFLRMLVISGAYREHDLSSLELVTYGTEPMPPSTLSHLERLLPGVGFKQTYGLSELGVLPTRSRASGSLWLQVGGVGCESEVREGILWIRSETAMMGYLNAPSPFDAEGWYNTEDLVEVDGPYLRILGRHSDLINVGGEKVYPVEVESVLLQMDNVREATVWGRRNAVTGHVVAARISLERPEDTESVHARVHRFCRHRLAPYQIPVHVEIADGEHHGARFKKVRPGAGTVAAAG